MKEKKVLNDKVRSSLAGSFIQLSNGMVHYEHFQEVNAKMIAFLNG